MLKLRNIKYNNKVFAEKLRIVASTTGQFTRLLHPHSRMFYLDQQPIFYEEVGCFKDNQVDPRPLPELLADLTGEVDWYDLSKVIRKCARLASEKGYTVFGLQSFGYCRSGKDAAETYISDGDSAGCFGGMGGRGENLVFKIIPQRRFLA